MAYFIGIDIGTSGTKTALFDEKGRVVTARTVTYPMAQPQNGWAEQAPEDWWQAVRTSLAEVAEEVERVDGIGLSGQMHGLVMLDGDGAVIRPAILWCDQRTGRECAEITEAVGRERLIAITANPALTGFTAAKILWVRKHEPENYSRCRHILLPKDYIRYKLTGEFATDVSDAGGMQLLDIRNRCWSDEVLEKLAIDKALLPAVYESPEITGVVRGLGKLEGVPVAAGAGDNAAAAVGTGTVMEGKAFTTIGSSGVVYAQTDRPVIDTEGRVHTFCCAVPRKWHVMGVTQAAGLSLKWFREQFAPGDSYAELDEQAEKVPVGAERLLFLPYLMGERTPHLNPNARGVFFGFSALHQKRHMVRAVMEGVSYSLRDCLEVLRQMEIPLSDMTVVGGGGKSTLWRQMLADIFGMEVRTVAGEEGPALGAAILAGVAVGTYPSVEAACAKAVRKKPVQKPDPSNTAAYETFYHIYQTLYPALKESFKILQG